MLVTVFRSLSTQAVTGFSISFFIFYQAQIVTEANRFRIFVGLLATVAALVPVMERLEKWKPRRFYRLKVFWTSFLQMIQTPAVWSLISIATRFMTEALASAFSLDAIWRVIVVVMVISAIIAAISDTPKSGDESQAKQQQ